jgi:hypothetical protein
MATVPIFAPDGTLGDIPREKLLDAVRAGAKPGVHVTSPEGKDGVVPADRLKDAVGAGAKVIPLDDQPVQHAGVWASLGADLGNLLHPSGFNPYPGMGQEEKSAAAANASEQDQQRAQEGRSLAYRAAVPFGQSVGLNVPGMEESARQGDVRGVIGHAAAPVVALAAGEVAGRVAPTVVEKASPYAGPVAKAVAKTVDIASFERFSKAYEAWKNLPADIRAKTNPPVFPKAPLGPETPAREVLQASSLARGPQPVVDPARGLGSIPVKPGSAGSMAESVAKPPVKPAVVEQQLKQALGAQDLKPGVPLKDQLRGANAQPKPQLPEGFTPVESTAMKGFKYDPATREFETITQGGQRYVHGDVSPEDAQAFMDAESKGKAWQQIRENPLVAKVINGKRVAIKPTASAEAAPTDDLMPKLQESLKQAQAAKANAGMRYVYRARDVGESGVPMNNDLAQATNDPLQAMKYAEAGQRGAKAGEVVKIDLSKLKPSDYIVKTHPSGAKWIQFTRPLTEDEVSAFTGKTASKK